MAVKGIWQLPFHNNIDAAKGSTEVCVVGVFGKSTWGHSSKSCVINRLTRTYEFPIHKPLNMDRKNEDEKDNSFEKYMPKIEAYFDEENQIIYLHLISIYDAATLADVAASIRSQTLSHSMSHDMLKNHEIGHLFGLTYLFSVCHILMLVHPVSQFDITYDRLFQRVASLRTKLVPVIKDVLKDCSVGRDWWVNGRPCPPRLLLVFQRCHLLTLTNKQSENEKPTEPGLVPKKKKPPVKRLQHTIEDQVYRILRSSRVLTNNAVNCLFSVPPNQAFVHIMTDEFKKIEKEEDPIGGMFDLLLDSFKRHRDPNSMSRAKELLADTPAHWMEDYMSEDERRRKESKDGGNNIRSFLHQHTSLVFDKKGFNDSIGRNPLPSHFELPTLKTWLKVANGLYNLLLTDQNVLGPGFEITGGTKKGGEDTGRSVEDLFSKVSNCRQYLRSKVDIEMKFSEARCSKVLPMAISVYQNSLPSHYTSKVHNNQLNQALLTYNQHARGPATDKYRNQLKSECMAFWRNGRQLCEVRSLTDRHCVHRFHILSQPNGIQDPDADPPILFHSSRSRSTATSSCGSIQGLREDPFDLKEANYDFYVILDKKAHTQPVEVYSFPVYQPGDEPQSIQNAYFTDGTASFSSQLLSTDNPDFRTESMGLQQSTSVTTQDEEAEGGKRKLRSRNISEGVTESETEDLDNPISTQGSADDTNADKDNLDASSQELSQSKQAENTLAISPRKARAISPKKERLESESDIKASKGQASVNLSFALSFGGHSEGSGRNINSPMDHDSQKDEAAGDQEQINDTSQKHNQPKEEAKPKINFIDGMIHSNCKKGVLPLYPCWSLVKTGSYSHYMAMRGLETPGFLPGTNFLVPWDIPVDKHKDDATQWPAPGEAHGVLGKKILSQAKEQKTLLGRRNRDDGSSVRAFIGYEYETVRGQRFICSGPDKPVKVTSSGTVKDSCHRLLESDMPLFTHSPSSGRSGKAMLGQLMRAFIVIPPDPSIEITINPHVIPGPPPTPTFTTGVPDISLSSDAVWVLRFPYVYVSDLGPHYIPKDSGILQMCKLLKGMIKLNKK
ncbi:nonsense-mediated mRNA decay factor SMG8-like [Styela clava]